MTDSCYTDFEYPNDKICINNATSKIDCSIHIKKPNEKIITKHYTKIDNNWSCNNCEIDQCKNIIEYNGDNCVILSNNISTNFNDSTKEESVLCINEENRLKKYTYNNLQWNIKIEPKQIEIIPQPAPPVDFNINNYSDSLDTQNLS
jgi:hypothetical protein